MSRGFKLLSLRSLLLTVVAMCVTSHVAAQAPVRIMPLGDSITAAPGCWRAYLWNQLQTAGYSNIDFVGGVNNGDGCGLAHDTDHEGHSGFSITGIADQNQLPPWLTAASPNIIVMHLGTNDMWGGHIPLQTKITAMTKLIGQMRANNPNIKIVMAQIIPMNAAGCTTCMPDVIAFNNALVTLAASLNTAQSPIFLVDQWTGFDVVADTFDAVHPITSGFIKMANRFFPVVAQALNTGAPVTSTLSVSKAGAGNGTVSSSPAGINCGTTCSGNFTTGSSVIAHRLTGQRLDIRGLERRMHGHRRLHGDDGRRARGDRHVQQFGEHLCAQLHACGHRHGHRHVQSGRHQLRQHLHG